MLPALPLIAVGIAAAAAGWAGASWWSKLHGRREEPLPPSAAGGPRAGRRPVQALTRCPRCQTWFVAGAAHGCDDADCPLRPAG